MKTQHRLARELKIMMSSQPLESISVSELSDRCHVSRKTFYYHYHDVHDLLTQVFLDEKIKGTEETTNIKELVDLIWNYYQDNKKFIDATLESAGKDLFDEFIYNIFYTACLRYIESYDDCNRLKVATKRAISRFYASGYSNSIVYYLSNFKSKTYKGLTGCISFINNEHFKKSIQNAIQIEDNLLRS